LPVDFSDGRRRLDLLVDGHFPRSALRVALVDRPPFLTWPHVEKDGALCLLGGAAEVSAYDPVGVAETLLGDAASLIEDLIAGRLDADFEAEFLSYWDWSKTIDAPPVRSLLATQGPSRSIRVWRGRAFYLLAESDADLQTWLRNFDPGRRDPFQFEEAVLVWRPTPPSPRDYPASASTVLSLADERAAALIMEQAAKAPERLLIALGAPTVNGACFGAIILRRPLRGSSGARGGGETIYAGFRPGRGPPAIISRRYLGGASFMRSSVERADSAWVHGRGQDPRHATLKDATATVLGCGSVGGPVAVLLAQAGVGRIRLVDPEDLKTANTGRHPLGATHVRQMKAVALASRLAQSYPHLKIEAKACAWEDLPEAFALFRQSSVIVSTIGSWAAEGGLNAAHMAAGRRPQIVYGWTEPLGCAGHAVAIGPNGGCLQCGFDPLGTPRLQATRWPAGTHLQQEPACGAVYQPYGPAELTYTVGMIAEMALDCLLGEFDGSGVHRVWAGDGRRLVATGGDWTATWVEETRQRVEGRFVHERPWEPDERCLECARRAAAA